MRRIVAWLAFSALVSSPALAADDARGLEFFERKIRPVLVEQCAKCHSAEAAQAKKLRGGLRVDTRDGLLKGGDTGPAVVPGKPDESPLIAALRYDDAVQMPPRGKLPDAVLADFVAWVEMGAPDPRTEPAASAATAANPPAKGRDHWAYQPPHRTDPPAVSDTTWPAGPIDRFVLAKLEAAGLRPAADADRPTLIRRLTFDLIGLPPSPAEIDAFVADPSPLAYERLVDRLLASPHFGERWGRHWLDVARFAESLTLRGFVLPGSWRYRDHVIASFNEDRPIDRFLAEQLAGDLLPADDLDDRRRKVAAASFLALGNTNLEEQDKQQLEMDVVDEQIDVISKAMLGQTIACARCHDHKFDPIPTRDYYALAAILANARALEHANVSKWLEHPWPLPPEQEAERARQAEAVARLDAEIKAERKRLADAGRVPASGVVSLGDVPGIVVDDAQARRVGHWLHSTYSKSYIGDGYLHDEDAGKGERTLTFQPDLPAAGEYEIRLAYSPGGSRSDAVPVTILSADGEETVRVDMRPAPPIDGRWVSLGRHRFERNGQGYVLISNDGTKGHVTADAVTFLAVDQVDERANAAGDDRLRALEAELKRRKAELPRRETVPGVVERGEVAPMRVHVRGSVHSLGEPVGRGFLSVACPGGPPTMPDHESGRRELAAWVVAADNPLTARVFVNRAWHWLFGAGLVRTVDNFGTTGEAPSHPELLDTLALDIVADGWSARRLVRRIVLSRTYRLASADDADGRRVDPENRLLWRHDRRRLDAEAIRDALLCIGGILDPAMAGPGYEEPLAADYGFKHAGHRRSVYSPVFRNALPELFEVFDFADPSMVVGRRDASTVAPQALFLLNHPFVIEQSRRAAHRLLAAPGDAARIERACQLTLGRAPDAAERDVLLRFVAGADDTEAAWSLVFQSLFASADFRSID